MKNNQPVTQNEVPFPNGEEIISTTDLKGSLTSFNDTFLKISGFEPEELLGKNHNVVRHPDMPPAAFADLWQHVKEDKHWMGIVKNRCKNGDFYWVDAYVTAIKDNGQTVGYESVRAKASPEQIERATKIYKQINEGKKPALGSYIDRISMQKRSFIINAVALVTGGVAYGLTPAFIQFWPVAVGLITGTACFLIGSKWVFSPLNQALKNVHKDVNNPLMALIYTGRSDEIGQLQLPAQLHKAKLRTVLGRIMETADKVKIEADSSVQALSKIHSTIENQASETDMVATAMNEMTASIHEVAKNASYAAQKAEVTNQHSKDGVQHASGAMAGLYGLNQAIRNVSDVVSQLDANAQNIGVVVDVIKSIAEQTNLLALNAAIEAARAGEQGRGFAVVADEVRTLAGRTQQSTQEIQKLIENLYVAVTQAVKVMGSSQETASQSEGQVTSAIESLKLIAEQVNSMSDLNIQIATAVEEQSSVSEEMNRNITQISHSSSNVLHSAESANTAAQTLSAQSISMKNMIDRFRVDNL
jgi:aerotaxis receptor|tara:strand:- start:11427 stop:13016 length:1590 start_codon:yes stop_codon:yes gene_type:complete